MRYWMIVFYILTGISVFSQKKPDPAFLNHLMNREYFREVLYLTDQTDFDRLDAGFRDSLHYMRGWSLYSLKKLNQSASEFEKVGATSTFYHKSRFFAAYNFLYIGNNTRAANTLDRIQINNPNLNTLRNFEKAGIALMNRNFSGFDKAFNTVDTSYYPLAEESVKLNNYATELRNHQPKSPFLAGLMSSIIPGSGKIYAGKTGGGISSLLTVGGLGLVTWENYRKRGLKDFKTLLFGAVFTTYYIGNIYGTVFSVKIAEDEYQAEYDHKILFNLHIPLRNVFD